ncbi:hypothetical protein BMIN_1467 [Bifidobacterium minimum]|uniref:Uncharacterized protein n=1 Tax=Bifidobacterium minimum TaxID=1693 RepID=A0A087BLA2_9BIFI|nr:hypothetical protein BMIN_1467 [Bifidobacterium minimum]
MGAAVASEERFDAPVDRDPPCPEAADGESGTCLTEDDSNGLDCAALIDDAMANAAADAAAGRSESDDGASDGAAFDDARCDGACAVGSAPLSPASLFSASLFPVRAAAAALAGVDGSCPDERAMTVTPWGACPPLRAAWSVCTRAGLRMVDVPRSPIWRASSLSSGSFISSRFWLVATGFASPWPHSSAHRR